jgi:hypothetical protein
VHKNLDVGLLIGGLLVQEHGSIVHQALHNVLAINAIPPPLLPFKKFPTVDTGRRIEQCGDVLGGGVVVVVYFEPHVSNLGNVLHPISCMVDNVGNFFALLVDRHSGGGCFGDGLILQ